MAHERPSNRIQREIGEIIGRSEVRVEDLSRDQSLDSKYFSVRQSYPDLADEFTDPVETVIGVHASAQEAYDSIVDSSGNDKDGAYVVYLPVGKTTEPGMRRQLIIRSPDGKFSGSRPGASEEFNFG